METNNILSQKQKYKELVASGDAAEQYTVACNLRDGKGLIQDFTMAVELFKAAAEKGSVEAMNALASMFSNDQFSKDNAIVEAKERCEQAAEYFHPVERYVSARTFEEEYNQEVIIRCVCSNQILEIYDKVLKVLISTGDVNNITKQWRIYALHHLGCYYYDKGNKDDAIGYLQKAVEEGYAESRYKLAQIQLFEKLSTQPVPGRQASDTWSDTWSICATQGSVIAEVERSGGDVDDRSSKIKPAQHKRY